MFEFILVFLVVAISFAGLSLGSIVNKKPITGSCGGIANLKNGAPCQI